MDRQTSMPLPFWGVFLPKENLCYSFALGYLPPLVRLTYRLA